MFLFLLPDITLLLLTFSAVGLCLLLTWLLLEFHVAKVHDGSNDFIAAVFLIRKEAEDVHGVLQRGKRGRYLLSTCSAFLCV